MQYRGLTLDRFQEEAITHLMGGRSVLVCAPTGTGKTIIADWVVEEALSAGRMVVYTAPIKALSNQKFRDYTRLYGEEQVGLVTGDLVIRRDAPCRVMTTEILRNMLLGSEDLSKLHAVIIDEIHFLDDRERGTVWEEILIYLPPHVLIVGLSATLSNQHQFSSWLSSVRGAPVEVVVETKRSVPLTFHIANSDTGMLEPGEYDRQWKRRNKERRAAVDHRGRGRGGQRGERRGGQRRDRKSRFVRRTRHSDIIRMLVKKNLLPCLYFCFSRRDIEIQARWLARNLRAELLTHRESHELDTRLDRAREELEPLLSNELLAMYRQGIAFHHAGLHVSLKALVEELYEKKLIKVLYCTSTFALGINMPARAVAFDGLKKFDGRAVNPLTVRGFMQKAGRAGRRGLDDSGHVVLRIDWEEYDEIKPLLAHYFEGRSEPVRSSFSLSWNSVVSLLGRNDRKQVREIVDKSFLAWHLEQRASRHNDDAKALEDRAESSDKQQARRAMKEAKKLRKRADRANGRCWNDFVQKEEFLKRHGYIGSDGSFNAGAKVLVNLQIAEILVVELILSGLLDDLDDPTLFGVLCALVSTFPRKVQRRFPIPRNVRDLARQIEAIRHNGPVLDAEQITETEAIFSPPWIPLGQEWVRGADLPELLSMIDSETDVSGDIVGTFRRAKDLCKQLAAVYRDLPDRSEALIDLSRRVSRDEVEVVG